MRVREIRIIGSVLSRELGWGWPLFLLNCVARKRSLFSDTHWAKDEGPESQFANRLSISAAIYLALVERLGKDRAFEMMREILVPIGCEEQMSNVTSLEVPSDDPMDRLWAFYDFMRQGGWAALCREPSSEATSCSTCYRRNWGLMPAWRA